VVLWWIGNAVLILVVIPVVLLFLNRVLRPIVEIDNYVSDVRDHGVALTGTLDCIPTVARAAQLTGSARLAVTRYGLALARLLEGR
jgi:integral membrane sensor domain MASE1